MLLPTVILPGYFASAIEYKPLESELIARGIPTVTVPLLGRNWIPTLGGRSMVPILRAIDRAVCQLLEQYNSDRVNLVAHSAGGWIARIYLGEKHYDIHGDAEALWNARARVATLITLGTPHTSQERWTLRNLNFVNDRYPGAFYPDVRYICVAGKSIYGARPQNWLAYNSYKLTCGVGNCWGDGITPIVAAHLSGAENLTLEGVMHSPRGGRLWYGSAAVREAWVKYLVD